MTLIYHVLKSIADREFRKTKLYVLYFTFIFFNTIECYSKMFIPYIRNEKIKLCIYVLMFNESIYSNTPYLVWPIFFTYVQSIYRELCDVIH